MWFLSNTLFWSSLGVVSYTYAAYPLAIRVLSKIRPNPVKKQSIEPSVSIVIAARNEEKHIARKIENLLSVDYPMDKLQIVVVSDGSTDKTDKIVRTFQNRGVVFERLESPSGKPTAINLGVERAEGEIVVFCDVRQRVDKYAIRALVEYFADPSIGAVSGELFIDGEQGSDFYWKYEKLIRAAESDFDSVPGATGALFAIRRKLFKKIPAISLLDDVFTPMQIVLRGYRVLFSREAKVYDQETDLKSEFRRKARTLAGNLQLLDHMPELLNPLKNRVFWQFASHKLARLICPLALVTLFGSNVVLVMTLAPGWPIYVVTLQGQLMCYGLALKGFIPGKKAGRISKIAQTFIVLNAGAASGFWRYIKKDFNWTH